MSIRSCQSISTPPIDGDDGIETKDEDILLLQDDLHSNNLTSISGTPNVEMGVSNNIKEIKSPDGLCSSSRKDSSVEFSRSSSEQPPKPQSSIPLKRPRSTPVVLLKHNFRVITDDSILQDTPPLFVLTRNAPSPSSPMAMYSPPYKRNTETSPTLSFSSPFKGNTKNSCGRPPRNSPSSFQLPSSQNIPIWSSQKNKPLHTSSSQYSKVVLNNPLKLTKSKSTPASYKLPVQKSKMSQWNKILPSTRFFNPTGSRSRNAISPLNVSADRFQANAKSVDGAEKFAQENRNRSFIFTSSSDDSSLRKFSSDDEDENAQSRKSGTSESIFRRATPTFRNKLRSSSVVSDHETVPLNVELSAKLDDPKISVDLYKIANGDKTPQKQFDIADEIPPQKYSLDEDDCFGDIPHSSSNETQNTYFSAFIVKDKATFAYLCIFSLFGMIVRIYLGRIFGVDCEFPELVTDFISPLSTCVTASGRTDQRGGALFSDLPANVLGSFFMGILATEEKGVLPIPWLNGDHQLQSNTAIHSGLQVAFCGSITTFASWNTQMIVMMVGSYTTVGMQLVSALFGYALGLVCAISSFLFGRQIAICLNNCRNYKNDSGNYTPERLRPCEIERGRNELISRTFCSTMEDADSNGLPSKTIQFGPSPERNRFISLIVNIIHGKYFYFFLLLVVFCMFLIADIVMDIRYYRKVWVSSLFAIPGTLLRWKLSLLNGKLFKNSQKFNWIPWGTLIANILGSITSVIAQALTFSLDPKSNPKGELILFAIQSGFAGNLSTVSSYVKEIVRLSEKGDDTRMASGYAIGSIFICCLLSLCIYLPLVLYN